MGRIVDLCGEVAASAEEGPDGLFLGPEERLRLGSDWSDEDIDDALSLVHESLAQLELVDAADSLNTRLLDVFGAFGNPQAFAAAQAGGGTVSIEAIGQIARRVARLEEVLEVFREGVPPDRRDFDTLQARLRNLGIEDQMETVEGEPEEE
jgi:hypothetical protein